MSFKQSDLELDEDQETFFDEQGKTNTITEILTYIKIKETQKLLNLLDENLTRTARTIDSPLRADPEIGYKPPYELKIISPKKPGIAQIDWDEVLEPIFPTDVVGKFPELIGLVGETITNTLARGELRLNSLGLEMHSLEAEVDDMLRAAEKGQKDLLPPKYKRGEWKNPLDYLEDVYGKYLAAFNETGLDYFYQDQMRKIDKQFLTTFNNWLARGGHVSPLADFVKPKSVRISAQLEKIGDAETTLGVSTRKLTNLRRAKYRR